MLLSRLHDCTPLQANAMSSRSDARYASLAVMLWLGLFAHRVPVPRGPVVHLVLRRLGSSVVSPLVVQPQPLRVLRVAGQLPT